VATASTVELNITGMTCASCAGRVERALGKVAGVGDVSVNLASERAHLRLDRAIDPELLLQAVDKAGYTANLPQRPAPAAADRARALSRERWTVLLALALALPLVLPMLVQPLGLHWPLPAWLQWLLATPVQFMLGARFYRSAYAAVRAGAGNMDLLVAVGSTAGYGLSLYLWLSAPPGHTPHLYFEASAVVIAMVLLGKYLESRAKRQAVSALRLLEALRPEQALRLRGSREERVAVEQLRRGDLIIVKPGERFAVDGIVIEGRSQADEALISGESLPVSKAPGDRVTGGAINGEGRLLIEAAALGSETVLAQIIRLVEDAQAAKAPIQQLVDRVSQVFVPVVLLIATLTLLGWWLSGAPLEQAIITAVAVLVIACPCALGLATPAAIMAGTGVAARQGILIKDTQVLERAHRVTDVVFDKTGTLTCGTARVVHLLAIEGNEAHVLRLAGALQQGSEHPLAHAVLHACRQLALAVPPVADSQALAGRGTVGTVDGIALALGNRRLLQDWHVEQLAFSPQADAWEAQGLTLSWLVQHDEEPRLLGLLAFGDTLRPGAAPAVTALTAQGIACHLLTGDNQGSAEVVARALNIASVHAQVLPADKAQVIADLQRSRHVAMVGDGINDAPALAAAHIGMAMGGGTDIAIQAAAITLMRPDPQLVAAALDICRRTHAKIRQNLFWAFVYNGVGIVLAVCGLLNPVFAGAAMALSSVSVVSNALLLKTWKPALANPPQAEA